MGHVLVRMSETVHHIPRHKNRNERAYKKQDHCEQPKHDLKILNTVAYGTHNKNYQSPKDQTAKQQTSKRDVEVHCAD